MLSKGNIFCFYEYLLWIIGKRFVNKWPEEWMDEGRDDVILIFWECFFDYKFRYSLSRMHEIK